MEVACSAAQLVFHLVLGERVGGVDRDRQSRCLVENIALVVRRRQRDGE